VAFTTPPSAAQCLCLRDATRPLSCLHAPGDCCLVPYVGACGWRQAPASSPGISRSSAGRNKVCSVVFIAFKDISPSIWSVLKCSFLVGDSIDTGT
jgi:hypothetical protein